MSFKCSWITHPTSHRISGYLTSLWLPGPGPGSATPQQAIKAPKLPALFIPLFSLLLWVCCHPCQQKGNTPLQCVSHCDKNGWTGQKQSSSSILKLEAYAGGEPWGAEPTQPVKTRLPPNSNKSAKPLPPPVKPEVTRNWAERCLETFILRLQLVANTVDCQLTGTHAR